MQNRKRLEFIGFSIESTQLKHIVLRNISVYKLDSHILNNKIILSVLNNIMTAVNASEY